MKTYTWNRLSEDKQKQILTRPTIENNQCLISSVNKILQQVKQKGDQALIELTNQFDQVKLSTLKVSNQEFRQAAKQIKQPYWQAIKFAYQQIKTYQQTQLINNTTINVQSGITINRQQRAIQKIGLYIPGGSAPLVSTVLMLGIPSQIANNPIKILCTPPNKNGSINPYILATAKLCGINTIYKIGGAQAIAALAFGTESIPKVDKIFGPGNRFVTIAKQLITTNDCQTSIDLPAGPSEVLVIADENANAKYIAADLLSQAEHGEDSQVILITTTKKIINAVTTEINKQIMTLARQDTAIAALKNGCNILAENMQEAIMISNQYAPEHLILNVVNTEQYIKDIQAAGSVFLGHYAAETMGDYVSGCNHVLPTAGYAKSMSGLSVNDFLVNINFQKIDRAGLQCSGPYAMTLAKLEGLQAHANAIACRLIENEVHNEY